MDALRRLVKYPEYFFLVTGSVFGLLFLVITPPFQMPDEYAHFERIYSVAQGRLIPQPPPVSGAYDYIGIGVMKPKGSIGGGDYNPVSFLALYNLSSHLPYNPQSKTSLQQITNGFFIPLGSDSSFRTHNAAVYTPFAYAPQAVVVAFLRLFSPSPLFLFYSARLADLCVWLGLTFYAIGLLRFGRWGVALVALSPMAVYEGAAVSADGLTMGLAWVFIAVILRYLPAFEERMPLRWLFALPLILLGISLCKFFYVFLFFLLFLLRPKTVGGAGRYVLLIALALFLPMTAGYYWSSQVADLYTFAPEAAGKAQLTFIKSQTPEFMNILAKNILYESRVWARHFAGVFGWLDTPLPFAVSALYLLSLLIAGVTFVSTANILSFFSRVYIYLVCFIGLLLILTSLYVANSAYGAYLIGGMQGRYLLPFTPVVLLSLPRLLPERWLNADLLLNLGCCFVSVFTLGYSVFLIYNRYYL